MAVPWSCLVFCEPDTLERYRPVIRNVSPFPSASCRPVIGVKKRAPGRETPRGLPGTPPACLLTGSNFGRLVSTVSAERPPRKALFLPL